MISVTIPVVFIPIILTISIILYVLVDLKQDSNRNAGYGPVITYPMIWVIPAILLIWLIFFIIF